MQKIQASFREKDSATELYVQTGPLECSAGAPELKQSPVVASTEPQG